MGKCCGKQSMPRVLILGLDNAGKTTIFGQLKYGEVMTTMPTIGFEVETIEIDGTPISIWDLGGQEAIRELWKHYYKDTQGLVFVIDSNDKRRFQEVTEKITELNNEVELLSLPFLIFANKQDLPNSLNATELSQTLNLESIFKQNNRKWHVIECQASVNDDGLMDGFRWILNPSTNKNDK